ncbi:hypothetical protein VaNZ11_000611 [Volvox africanus]|uniref:RNA-binding S4 domain-containing protein n=1 Tax=Volvox africanus TaxID=51714 RepID=A0ABQ5RMP3_9CHLO|nr:hypothetical protein VaNZ11_000611 [Volvox africanus]
MGYRVDRLPATPHRCRLYGRTDRPHGRRVLAMGGIRSGRALQVGAGPGGAHRAAPSRPPTARWRRSLAGLQDLRTAEVKQSKVKGNFMFDPAKHPDFLGAIIGTGVVREKIGDILVQGESGAQILVDPELVEHFEMSLVQVRTVPVEVHRIPLSELSVRPPRQEEISSVEASLRLDAIASAGFRVSRTKMGEVIKAGDVRLNWRSVSKTSVEVKAGDVISCSGKGRLEVRAVEVTRKEKYLVTLLRYV